MVRVTLTTPPTPLRKAKGDASAASRGMPEIHRTLHIHNNRPAHNRRNASFQTATVTRIAAIPAITNANGAPHS